MLNDLDVRASDILQCNCIVWVEGPSDRIYVNEWIKLWSDDSLVEGLHYQCVIYGGKLLAHFSASTSDEIEEIQILRTNRNCIMIIDSDKSSDQDQLNDTKMRMAAEIESANGYLWITDGKEIEKYLPMEALNALAADIEIDQQRTPGKYENYFDYLNEAKEDVGDKYRKKKTHLADIAVKALHLDDWASMLDLNEKVTGVCDYIDKCNS